MKKLIGLVLVMAMLLSAFAVASAEEKTYRIANLVKQIGSA